MNRLTLIATTLLSFGLVACGQKGADNATAPAATGPAAVASPAGKQWTDVVSKTAEGGVVEGNPNAAVKVIEFGSFSCPHCRDFSAESTQDIHSMVNTGKLSYEYRTYIRDPVDMMVAILAHCGGAESCFPLSEQLFANQTAMMTKAQGLGDATYSATLSKPINERFVSLAQTTGLIDFVKQRGISETTAKQCLSDGKAIEALAKQVQDYNSKYNIQGTPTLYMNGSVVENTATWDAMKTKLKEAGI
ncbi:MAG: thioredoxin domain-containing protein [Sphingobium sp.]